MMPFITEEIWQRVKTLAGQTGDTIMHASFPVAVDSKIDHQAISDLEWIQKAVESVRNIRGEMSISPAKAIPLSVNKTDAEEQRRINDNRAFFTKLANLESITLLDGEEAPLSATALLGKMELLVPMAGLIDKDAEMARLDKEIDKLNKEAERIESKLSNAKFVDKAPAEVVAKERERLQEVRDAGAKMQEQKARIATL